MSSISCRLIGSAAVIAAAVSVLAAPAAAAPADAREMSAAAGPVVRAAATTSLVRAAVNADVVLPGPRGAVAVPAGSAASVDVRVAAGGAGQVVLLQVARGRWTSLVSARTDRRGVAKLEVSTAATGRERYRVLAPRTRSRAAVVSRPVAVIVRADEPTPTATPVPTEVPASVVPPAGPADAYSLFDTGRAGSVFRWDPCTPIGYRVRLDDAPASLSAEVAAAMGQVAEAAGLTFADLGSTTYAGSTTDPSLASWPAGTDLVITVADEAADRRLAGDTVGYAALLDSSWVGSDARINRAEVVLEREFLSTAAGPAGNRVRELLLHELGHAVGLAHSADASQVMYPTITGHRAYQSGDRSGLARVGAGEGCLR